MSHRAGADLSGAGQARGAGPRGCSIARARIGVVVGHVQQPRLRPSELALHPASVHAALGPVAGAAVPIRQVVVVGAGTLGAQVAFQAAISGFDVVVLDVAEAALDRCRMAHLKFARQFVARAGGGQARAWRGLDAGASPQAAADGALARLRYTTDAAAACKDCDIVSECVPEVPEIKASTYARLARLAPERAIFTTNTSMLLPGSFAQATGRPARFCALHFANGIFDRNVAEIMAHAGTDEAVIQEVVAFAKAIHMVPIRMGVEREGYVINAMGIPWMSSAVSLVRSGAATPEEVDRVWMISMQQVGPFASVDTIGLETIANIFRNWGESRKGEAAGQELLANAQYLQEMVDVGRVGLKGASPKSARCEGFYRYPNPPYLRKDFLE